jgi:hypothetical protein
MPGGGRETHDFPSGKPILLTLLEIVTMIFFAVGLGLFQFDGWRTGVPTLAIAVAFAVLHSFLISHYERTGDAIPIARVSVVVKYPRGLPKPLLAARLSFFVVVALMLAFGIGPFQVSTARHGIIGCVFGLIGVAVLNLLLEHHYVKAGRATEIEFISNRNRTP